MQTSFGRGALYTLLLWLLIQAAVIGWQLLNGTRATFTPDLDKQWTYLLGLLLGQLLANALFEEAVWRGFLLPQLFFKLQPKLGRWAIQGAFVVTALAFSLLHVPNQLVSHHTSLSDLPFWLTAIFLSGLLFAWVYLVSKSLYVTLGFHALFNERTLIVSLPEALLLNSDVALTTLAALCGPVLLLIFRRRSWR